MIYTAQLFIGECLYKTIAIEHPREQIVFHSPRRLDLIAHNPITPAVMRTDTMIFRIDRQIGHCLLRYVFDYATGQVRNYGDYIIEVFDEGFLEPDENVNLDKLKQKFRSREKMTELLLKYYRS